MSTAIADPIADLDPGIAEIARAIVDKAVRVGLLYDNNVKHLWVCPGCSPDPTHERTEELGQEPAFVEMQGFDFGSPFSGPREAVAGGCTRCVRKATNAITAALADVAAEVPSRFADKDRPEWRRVFLIDCPDCGTEHLHPIRVVDATCPDCDADWSAEPLTVSGYAVVDADDEIVRRVERN